MIINVVTQKIPYGNIINFWVMNLLADGIMFACDAQANGRDLQAGDVFAGFQYKLKDLTIFSLLSFLVLFVMIFVAIFILGFAFAGANAGKLAHLSPRDISASAVLLIALIALVLIPVWPMLTFHAVPLVALYDVSPWRAMKMSFSGCLKNWAAFLVNFVVLFLMFFGCGFVLSIISGFLGAGAVLLIAPLSLFLTCSALVFYYMNAYASFSNIWLDADLNK